jgi:hypothetical protein
MAVAATGAYVEGQRAHTRGDLRALDEGHEARVAEAPGAWRPSVADIVAGAPTEDKGVKAGMDELQNNKTAFGCERRMLLSMGFTRILDIDEQSWSMVRRACDRPTVGGASAPTN